MDVREYAAFDGLGLAELIRTGQVAAAEVHEAAMEAIDRANPELNALVGDRFPAPLAHTVDGPFGGVPLALKDLILHAADVPMQAGSRLLGPGVTLSYDTDLMRRFRAAGFAALARTATSEFGFAATAEALVNGPTRNPWDLTRSPGGSSGGSAALVAAGAVPVAHANDGGGSIRVPAACCGLVGLKPSRGRTTPGPDHADPLLGLGVEFVLTRTVRDCAAALDAVHGAEPGDRYLLPPPQRPYAEEAVSDPRRLRIAVTTDPLLGDTTVDSSCRIGAEAVARRLETLGHHVSYAAPVIDAESFGEANCVAWSGFLAAEICDLAAGAGVAMDAQHLEATTLACVEYGQSLTAMDVFAAQNTFNDITRQVAAFFTEYDVLLSPTTTRPNFALGELDANDTSLDARGWHDALFEVGTFTGLFNATGQPAISLPLHTSPQGWPVGVQLVGRYADEATLLALAGQLERAMPWADRRPSVHVSH
ncbi:amidase [Saccharopolyspora rosea]|uniref:Amidase n=1 Tax=Saccharopolyspora rosea TaxID=524884 RepID=A0ABW3FZV9_9PSEU|nr:amidase family protein [Saccharopolyspora rosea]